MKNENKAFTVRYNILFILFNLILFVLAPIYAIALGERGILLFIAGAIGILLGLPLVCSWYRFTHKGIYMYSLSHIILSGFRLPFTLFVPWKNVQEVFPTSRIPGYEIQCRVKYKDYSDTQPIRMYSFFTINRNKALAVLFMYKGFKVYDDIMFSQKHVERLQKKLEKKGLL